MAEGVSAWVRVSRDSYSAPDIRFQTVVQPRGRQARRWGWVTHLVSIPGIVELVRRRVLRLQSLRLDVGKRRHFVRRSALGDADRSSSTGGEMRAKPITVPALNIG